MNRKRVLSWRSASLCLLACGGFAAITSPLEAQTAATQPTGTTRPSVIPQIRRFDAPPVTQPQVNPTPVQPVQNPLGGQVNVASPIPAQAPRASQGIPLPTAAPTGQIVPSAFFNEANTGTPAGAIPPAVPGEHPLAPAVNRARSSMQDMVKVQDYSATLVKRERIDGTLNEHEYLFVKVRHNPFSVYVYFLAPAKLKGQETIFVAGKNDGNLLAHPNGMKAKLIGTVSLKPTGMLAMTGNRHPITELGIRRLTERLLEVGENDMKYGECAVKVLPGAKINGRDCTCYEVNHPHPRKEFLFHIARIYVDTELNVPIRYEAYEWPTTAGGEPLLVEEYTYLNLKVNNGFTDLDFDINNPKYQFK